MQNLRGGHSMTCAYTIRAYLIAILLLVALGLGSTSGGRADGADRQHRRHCY